MVDLPPALQTVVASIHPAAAMRGGNLLLRNGIRTVIARAHRYAVGGMRPNRELRLRLRPSVGEVEKALAGADRVAVDIETPREAHRKILMVGLAVNPHEAYVVPWTSAYREVVAGLLASDARVKLGHNFAFDVAAFRANGVREAMPVYDTLQAAALLWPPQPRSKRDRERGRAALKFKAYSLDACALRVLDDVAAWKKHDLPATCAYYRAAWPEVAEEDHEALYCALDVIYTWRLWAVLETLLREAGMLELFTRIVAPAAHALRNIEERGLYVDVVKRDALRIEVMAELRACEQRISEITQTFHDLRYVRIAGKVAALEEECRKLVGSTPIIEDSPSGPPAVAVPPSTKALKVRAKRSRRSVSASPPDEPS